MKIKRVVFCLNNSPLYSGMWDIVSKVYTEKTDYIPTLIFVGTQKELEAEVKTSFGEVYRLDKHEEFVVRPELDWTVPWSLHWAIANMFPNDICLFTGIDEIPCNYILDGLIKDVDENKYIFMLGANPYRRPTDKKLLVANGWSIAKGSVLKQVLGIKDNLKEELNRLWTTKHIYAAKIPDNHHALIAQNWWGIDEAYISTVVYDNPNVLFFNQESADQLFSHRKICRAQGCVYDREKLKNGYYWEVHMPRPLSDPKNKKIVENILTDLGIDL